MCVVSAARAGPTLTICVLTKEQADALLAAPGVDNLLGLRDTAVIAVMLCTGVREAEFSALQVGIYANGWAVSWPCTSERARTARRG